MSIRYVNMTKFCEAGQVEQDLRDEKRDASYCFGRLTQRARFRQEVDNITVRNYVITTLCAKV